MLNHLVGRRTHEQVDLLVELRGGLMKIGPNPKETFEQST